MSNTPNQPKFWIPTDSESSLFDSFLKESTDRRIIFSAPFGAGKSTFLQHFFEARAEEYFCININASRYIANTYEQLVKSIRYDLAVRFFEYYESNRPNEEQEAADPTVVEKYKKVFSAVFATALVNAPELFRRLIAFIPTWGKPIEDMSKFLGKANDDYELLKSSAEQPSNSLELDLLGVIGQNAPDFLFDQYTEEIINNALIEFSKTENETSKKKILIVDDIDRLEPNMMFSVLNALASQFDENHSRYHFDLIIYVLDIKAVESTYYHLFGQKSNFSGYISKYSPKWPYCFRLNEVDSVFHRTITSISEFKQANAQQAVVRFITNLIIPIDGNIRRKKSVSENLKIKEQNGEVPGTKFPIQFSVFYQIITRLEQIYNEDYKSILSLIQGLIRETEAQKLEKDWDRNEIHYIARHCLSIYFYLTDYNNNSNENPEFVMNEVFGKFIVQLKSEMRGFNHYYYCSELRTVGTNGIQVTVDLSLMLNILAATYKKFRGL